MSSLEHRSYEQSFILLFKCIKLNGPRYISSFFEFRKSEYILRNNDHNLVQPSYNNRYHHHSRAYKMSHLQYGTSSLI